ncbi:hypothetical protein CTAYLR_000969 [Chrysophaeum taylorii]|uniref:2-methoxy-6-polyprenyl-1,4-benzoquinol methylase, mitochondrial n=1 Tax=Chrysophaeum taylorii TaxID=2483200 RepID=A0AAD7UFG8_9STRA|nr:hypothetical protein CTAYLR_000969 [Chrysophaeum taylorii]
MWRGVTAIAVIACIVATLVYYDESPASESGDFLGSGSMFDRIATRYDLANRFMSLGLDRGWRRHMVEALDVTSRDRVLDLATGTADVAILEGRRGARVLGVDPSERMLEVGRTKVAAEGLDVVLVAGDATRLDTLEDNSFDKVSIAFGIRNIPDVPAALSEMARIAAPNATLAILEFCEPEGGIFLAPIARLFIRHVVPRLGALLSGAHWAEYRHLQTSIAKFPAPPRFAELVADAGLEVVSISYLAFGSVALYVATKNQQPVR